MPFMSKATKKCNNGVDHSLHLVSSVFCVIKRQFTEFRFMSGHYQKRKTQTENKYKHQIPLYISEKIIKAAFFLKSQGMAKPDSFCQENRFIWTWWKLVTSICVHTKAPLQLMSEIGSLIIQRGLRVTIWTCFWRKKKLI